jgi:hypothetical protein
MAFPLSYSATIAIASVPVRDPTKDRVVMVCGNRPNLGACLSYATVNVVHYLTPSSLGGTGYESVRTTIEVCCAACQGHGKIFHGARKPATKCKACKRTGGQAVLCSYLTEQSELPHGLHGT